MKAFFYSMAVLLLLGPLIALVVYYSAVSAQTESQSVSHSVSLHAAGFVRAVEADFPRALHASSKSAIASSISKVVSEGNALQNSTQSLQNLAATGSFDENGTVYPAMGFNYLGHWAQAMQNLSLQYGLNSTISVIASNVTVSQHDPFQLKFTAVVSVFSRPVSTSYAFNFTRSFNTSVTVSIEGFEDPLYALNSQGLVARVFKRNSQQVSNATSLGEFISDEEYLASSEAPDFLHRLEADLSPSQFGLETVVDLNELAAQDIEIHNQSNVDHLYFNDTLSDQGHAVNGTGHSWLRLDCTHAQSFGVEQNTQGC